MTCEACGRSVRKLVVHDRALWCGPCHDGARAHAHGIVTDDIPGGFVQENFGDQPEVFYSKKAMALRAKELGLEPMVRWAGPHDKHVSRWDAVDEYTLRNAEELVARVAGPRAPLAD